MTVGAARRSIAAAPSAVAAFAAALLFGAGFAGCQQPTPAAQGQPAAPDPSLRERAFAAENQGRFAEAATLFLQLVQQQPDRADWVVAAGRCLGRAGRFNEAIDFLAERQQRFAGVPDVAAMLARTLLLKAERDPLALMAEVLLADAAELAEKVLALEPNHEDARLILAQARYLQGDWQQAVAAAEEAARRHPQRAGAHVLLGRIAMDRFRSLLQQYRDTQPIDQAAADLAAQIDTQRRLAQRSYATAAELDPTRPFPHIALGELAWLDKKTDAALQHFAKALAIDPAAAVPYAFLDGDRTWQQRAAFYQDAQQAYLARTGASAQAASLLQFHAARALFDGQQWQPALTAFDAVIATDPGAINALYYGALAAYRLGDHDGAEERAARLAARSAEEFAAILRNLSGDLRGEVGAIVQFLADRAYVGKRHDHGRDLNHVMALLRDSADAWNNYALMCRETQRYDTAWSAYESALAKEPDSPQLLNDAAVILHYHLPGQGNRDKARAMYERACTIADQVLADRTADARSRERAAEAKRNALANLAELDKPK